MTAGTEISPAQIEALLTLLSIEVSPVDKSNTESVKYLFVNNRVAAHSSRESSDAYILTVDPVSGEIQTKMIAAKHLGKPESTSGALKNSSAFVRKGEVFDLGSALYSASTTRGVLGYVCQVREPNDFDIRTISSSFLGYERDTGHDGSSVEAQKSSQVMLEAILDAELKGLNEYLDGVSSKVETFVSHQKEKYAARAEK